MLNYILNMIDQDIREDWRVAFSAEGVPDKLLNYDQPDAAIEAQPDAARAITMMRVRLMFSDDYSSGCTYARNMADQLKIIIEYAQSGRQSSFFPGLARRYVERYINTRRIEV